MAHLNSLAIVLISLVAIAANADTITCKSEKGAKSEITIKIEELAKDKVEGTFVRKYMPPIASGATEPVTETAKFKPEPTTFRNAVVFATETSERHDGRPGDAYVFIPYDMIGAAKGIVISQTDTSLKDASLNCSSVK